jgi:hypothetical protein
LAIAHIIGGLMLPVVVQLEIAQPYFRVMADVFALNSTQDLLFLQFLVGIFGPTVASWGVLFWAVVTQSFAIPTKGAWWLMILASVVWAVYDSIYSSFYGLWINALINGMVFVCIVVPLWCVRHEFE